MKDIYRNLFRAIFEDKWLTVEYRNKDTQLTHYWIAVKKIDIGSRVLLTVDGLHIGLGQITQLVIDLKKIQSSAVLEGTYYPNDGHLKEDIEANPQKYACLFAHADDIRILNYLYDCYRLDNVPYKNEYHLVELIDDDAVKDQTYILSDQQYLEVIRTFQMEHKNRQMRKNVQLALNILSLHTKRGLYVLAYRELHFDVIHHCFRANPDVTVCQQFSVNHQYEENIRFYLDEDDLGLLDDFMDNLSLIEDRIQQNVRMPLSIDDVPYLIAIEREITVGLEEEFEAIEQMIEEEKTTVPIRAFFGELLAKPQRNKNYPIALADKRVNLDQLLAIYNAVKYPLTYVQGPPGTGKTNTIINTIITAFFNHKTVLFTAYNNHPIDTALARLTSLEYHGQTIPLPVLHVGNNEKMRESLQQIKKLLWLAKASENRSFSENDTLNLNSNHESLTELLSRYEEITELKERRETVEKLMESSDDFNFQVQLQATQLNKINQRLKEIGEVTQKQALELVVDDEKVRGVLMKRSLECLALLKQPRYDDFIAILKIADPEEQIRAFNSYVRESDNAAKLLKAFPIVTATCLSAHKLFDCQPRFDLTIMDEASQCGLAVALIPIVRGKNLMLVGDPQQLNPVIQLDPKKNELLRQKYHLDKAYDYIRNSIYKTYLACDSISEEILLSHHYRCDKKIIEFCNRKYYRNKLKIATSSAQQPLVFMDVKENHSDIKNFAPREVEQVLAYVKAHPDKKIGVITPFVNQRKAIEEALQKERLDHVSCGTVHAFQGDEKDEILFSLALSDKTSEKTYHWLNNNQELINVGVSRAKEKLILVSSLQQLERLHQQQADARDDLYELARYTISNGQYQVTELENRSRALGIKPYSSETEEAFMISLNHALGNIFKSEQHCSVKKEVSIAAVFSDNPSHSDLFYSGRFDFVVYQRRGGQEYPILAIELDGKEHHEQAQVQLRDAKKNAICAEHGFDLIRIDNSYARRYNYIKDILIDYFAH